MADVIHWGRLSQDRRYLVIVFLGVGDLAFGDSIRGQVEINRW